MRLFNKYMLLALAIMAAAQGCDKEPIGTKDTGAPIMLSASEAGTKALLNKGSFKTTGNRIQIYDYYTPKDNALQPYYYIGVNTNNTDDPNEYIISNGPDQATWPFVNNRYYSWTSDGVHSFFGWLDTDANTDPDLTASGFFGRGYTFNKDSKVLTIPEIVMDASTAQFDFMYSDIYIRDLNTNPDYLTPVELNFSHLFTAFGIKAQDNTSASTVIKVKTITVNGLKCKNSAKIQYNTHPTNGSTPSVDIVYETGTAVEGGTYTFTYDGEGKTLTKNTSIDMILPDNDKDDYYLMWPHNKQDFKDVNITVTYTLKDSEYTKTIKLPDNYKWDAGNKYAINLIFDKEPGSVWVNYIVANWEDVQWDLEFEAPLHTFLLTEPKTDAKEPEVVPTLFYDNTTALGENGAFSGYFKMDSPAGITWKPTLINASAADYEIRVYTNKKEDGSTQTEYNIPVTTANIDAEQDRFYKIVIVAKNPDNIGKVVKLGITYAPLWNEEANPLLVINGSSGNLYYPWTPDINNNKNNPDVCWISIKQIAQ